MACRAGSHKHFEASSLDMAVGFRSHQMPVDPFHKDGLSNKQKLKRGYYSLSLLVGTGGFGLVHQRNCNHYSIGSRSSQLQMDRVIGTEMKKDVALLLNSEDSSREKAKLVVVAASYLLVEPMLVEHFNPVLLPNPNTYPLVRERPGKKRRIEHAWKLLGAINLEHLRRDRL